MYSFIFFILWLLLFDITDDMLLFLFCCVYYPCVCFLLHYCLVNDVCIPSNMADHVIQLFLHSLKLLCIIKYEWSISWLQFLAYNHISCYLVYCLFHLLHAVKYF